MRRREYRDYERDMLRSTLLSTMTDGEVHELERAISRRMTSVAELQGFLIAIVSGPLIGPSGWIDKVLGDGAFHPERD